jgi:hypothetical protein
MRGHYGAPVDRENWIRAHVEPTGPIELTHDRPWSQVLRVPVADGVVWFKAAAPAHAFEPRLTAELSARWAGLVADVSGAPCARCSAACAASPRWNSA